MNLVNLVEDKQLRKDLAPFNVGDTVKVHVIIREGDKERIQIFRGDVIGKRGGSVKATFTVRKVSFGIGVERVFPLHSKMIKTIEVVRKANVRRAKLYYLRDLKGKAARLKEDQRLIPAGRGHPQARKGALPGWRPARRRGRRGRPRLSVRARRGRRRHPAREWISGRPPAWARDINDSKLLSPARREELAAVLLGEARAVGVGLASAPRSTP